MIRLAAEADIPRLTDIRNAVRENRLSDPSLVTPADYRWFIAQRSLFVWQENDVLVGFSAADARDGSIWALFVDPLYEGRGVGRVLLEHACAILERAGFPHIWLTTAPGTRAARFYRRRVGVRQVLRTASYDWNLHFGPAVIRKSLPGHC